MALLAAIPISLAGALIWSRVVVTSDPSSEAVLTEPGEYVEPGAATNPPLPTDRLPIVDLLGADGSTVELASDGRPMVVNLWYSTCPPCARELVDFAAVHEQLGDAVRFVGVNPLDSAAEMERFAADRGVDYELLRDPDPRSPTRSARSPIPSRCSSVATGSCSNAPGPSTPTSCASASPTTGPSGDEVT